MVRFGDNYAGHINESDFPVKAYINYDLLKRKIHEYEDMPPPDEDEQHASSETIVNGSSFSAIFKRELERIDELFSNKLRVLDYNLVDTVRLADNLQSGQIKRSKAEKKAVEAALKRSTTIVYQKLAKLEKYSLLNRTAVIKILKKYDKVCQPLGHAPLFHFHMAMIDDYEFGHCRKVKEMVQRVENLYSDVFCQGVLEEARGKLQLAKGARKPSSHLLTAFKVGALMTLMVWFFNNLVLSPVLVIPYFTMQDPAIYLYAAVASLIIFRWIWAFNIYMWESVNIDYILVLNLDSNKHMPAVEEILSEAASWSILFFANVMIFHSLRMYNVQDNIDQLPHYVKYLVNHAYWLPISIVVGTIANIVRSALLPTSYGVFAFKVFKELVKAPFSIVELRHTFAADILTSFTKVTAAVAYTACYFGSRAYLQTSSKDDNFGLERFQTCSETGYLHGTVVFLYLWPLYIRFMQNMRQQYDSVQRRKIDSAIASKKVHIIGPENCTTGSSTEVCSGDHSSSSVSTHEKFKSGTLVHRKSKGQHRAGSRSTGGESKSSAVSAGIGLDNSSAKVSIDSTPMQLVDIESDSPTAAENRGHDDEVDRSDSENDDDDGEDHFPDDDDDDDDDDDVADVEKVGGGLCGSKVKKTKSPNSPRLKPSARLGSARYRSVSESFIISKSRGRQASQNFLSMLRRKYIPSWLLVWPYSYNALKYFLSMLVVIFGAYPPYDPERLSYKVPYLTLCAISTMYSIYWDIANDWQLGQMNPPNYLLREPLYYGETEYFYYIVIVTNAIFRSFWTLGFTPYGKHSFLVVFEILRRSLWSCLRMEVAYIQEINKRK